MQHFVDINMRTLLCSFCFKGFEGPEGRQNWEVTDYILSWGGEDCDKVLVEVSSLS